MYVVRINIETNDINIYIHMYKRTIRYLSVLAKLYAQVSYRKEEETYVLLYSII